MTKLCNLGARYLGLMIMLLHGPLALNERDSNSNI